MSQNYNPYTCYFFLLGLYVSYVRISDFLKFHPVVENVRPLKNFFEITQLPGFLLVALRSVFYFNRVVTDVIKMHGQ